MKYYDADPLDVTSFSAGVQRRFGNISFEEPDAEHILLFLIGCNAPQAEFSSEAMEELLERRLLN